MRQVFSDWKNETPGEVHIDRVGFEGKQKPVLSEAAMAARLSKAAEDLTRSVASWPDFVLESYMKARPANMLSTPADPTAVGGVPGRFMSNGHFELAEGEALVVTVWPIGARYQGIQLADPWFSSLEYANRVTSLSADQARRAPTAPIASSSRPRDPGVQNWLDTTGLPKGAMLIRFDGSELASFPKDKLPVAREGRASPLCAKSLPEDTPVFTPEHARGADRRAPPPRADAVREMKPRP